MIFHKSSYASQPPPPHAPADGRALNEKLFKMPAHAHFKKETRIKTIQQRRINKTNDLTLRLTLTFVLLLLLLLLLLLESVGSLLDLTTTNLFLSLCFCPGNYN